MLNASSNTLLSSRAVATIFTPLFRSNPDIYRLGLAEYRRSWVEIFIAELNSEVLSTIKLASSLLTRNAHSYTHGPQVLAAPTRAISKGGQRQLNMRYNEGATPSVKHARWLWRKPAGLLTAATELLQEANGVHMSQLS